ncbi:MAG TPA: hypothetical protein DDY91_20515 [Planctomycetaceae bacterium]|nr:hypothetical protein [Planctomycetaceae bacterium]
MQPEHGHSASDHPPSGNRSLDREPLQPIGENDRPVETFDRKNGRNAFGDGVLLHFGLVSTRFDG